MKIYTDKTGSLDGFETILRQAANDETVNGLMILACDNNGFVPENCNDILRTVTKPVFGGIFPAILNDREKLDKGAIVAGLSSRPEVFTIPELSNSEIDYYSVIEEISAETVSAKTMFLFVDGYSQRISSLIDNLYDIYGHSMNYIGGGAGSINPVALDMGNTPCLFTNDGLITDSAVLAFTNMDSGIGVSHGWHKISGPYKITESSDKKVKSLDWRPAFEVYKEVLTEHSGKEIREDNFFEIARNFPFGISRIGSEIIVRDLFTGNDESMIVATEIPQESFIDILTGDKSTLIRAAGDSYSAAVSNFSGVEKQSIMLFDCISRVLYLDDEFDKEIDAALQDDLPMIGVLSLGEIANNGEEYMELYNKTIVTGILGA